jgi:hypothetical protein
MAIDVDALPSESEGITASDINDGDIMAKMQVENSPDGRFRFHQVLPSGRAISSDWILQEHQKSMARQWIEAVKQQIIADGSAARDAALAAQRNKLMQESSLENFLDVPKTPVGAILDRHGSPAAIPQRSVGAGGDAPLDPVESAKRALLKATEDEQYWEDQEQEARTKKEAAQKAAMRWSKVLNVLGED